ncbi:histidine phosphotransferase [Qipengyuania sp. 1NDW9]|uniref:Histidine phosphotransferase n=2 Tax=Qipengyuania TaxID=1855416 RepID=A0A9Q3S1Z0_9SPHN|nr:MULTISPECIES: histidine phosphotransferase family protein [Qipengyuania]MBX7492246.1 histidine phosphotransferase [Qipengyuania xiapuensis]MBY6218581.1 histidine phosphotransferase [Qipengyuania aquimaris]QZD93520.1 histidine phosphotransferase [Qipengyuania xiapuensis]UOR15652.1 histidine phosphotransferase family protein [Qipengyuania aquimaris]
MNDSESIDLAAMLCSRLCHDMLSPVGALSNGLELLAMETDPEMRRSVIELLEQSSKTSTNKLKFFRLAFGAAGGFGDRVDVEEPKALIDALVADKDKVEINWAIDAANLAKPAVKVLLNFAQIAIDALVRGGSLDIGAEVRGKNCEIVVRATGSKIGFDENIGKALDGTLPHSELSSRTAAAHMIALLAEQAGGGLQYARTDETLVLGAVLPEAEGLIG